MNAATPGKFRLWWHVCISDFLALSLRSVFLSLYLALGVHSNLVDQHMACLAYQCFASAEDVRFGVPVSGAKKVGSGPKYGLGIEALV